MVVVIGFLINFEDWRYKMENKIFYTLEIFLKRKDKQRNTKLEYVSKDIKDIENEIIDFSDKFVSDIIQPEFFIKVDVKDLSIEIELPKQKRDKKPKEKKGIDFKRIPKSKKIEINEEAEDGN